MRAQRKNRAIAFTGILTALCVVFLYLGSIIDVLDYTVSALCGILVTFAIVEYGNRAGIAVWLGSSFLALLFLPSKFSSLLFIAFCGWYSLVKKVFERKPPFICILLKFITFNLALFVIAFITLKLFAVESVTLPVIIGVGLLSNATFFIYDTLITRLIYLYVIKWRQKFKIK